MFSQGMLFCLLFTVSISICLFMYIHQKTSSIEKNIKNVVHFIQGIERDVQGMNNQQTMSTDKVVVSDSEDVHDGIAKYENIEEDDDDDEDDSEDENTDNEDDSEDENADNEDFDVMSNIKGVDMFKNIMDSQAQIHFDEGVVDINTSPLHEMFNIQVVKTFESNQSKPIVLNKTQLNNMTVPDLRKELRNHDSTITSYNAKKMKKTELIDKLYSYFQTDNEHDTDTININVGSNENKIESVLPDIDSSND